MSDPTQTSDAREIAVAAQKLDALGPYRLIEIVGQGGMGAVYRAEQTAPVRREVAIKVTRVGLGAVGRLARFESERQILATLSHPHIAKVFDAGETEEGFPYLVMEYIAGEAIDVYCDRARLRVDERIALMIEACEAVTYAHQHGVIHRDIKPANLLVDLSTGRATTRLIDFGIAKLAQGAGGITETGSAIGTPAYMSPEQADASGDVDTRTDVYALGMTLYRLLAGTLPGDASGEHTLHRQTSGLKRPSRHVSTSDDASRIAERYQMSADALVQTLARDLDWIVLKATDPDRERRYASVTALADDLRRYLDGFPVFAAPPSTWDVLRKFIARHRIESAAVAALIVAIATTFVLVFSAWRDEREARALADAQLRQHEAFNAFVLEVMATTKPATAQKDVSLREVLMHAQELSETRFADDPVTRMAIQSLIRSAISHARIEGTAPEAGAPAPPDAESAR